MTVSLPRTMKSLISLSTPSVLEVELNDVDVDRMMTHVLELGVKKGRRAASRTVTTNYDEYLSTLHGSDLVSGFDGEDGLEVLDGWIRASILKMERAGLKRDVSQMGYLRPVTIAAYRSGLPKSTSRHRRADTLTYRSMERHLESKGIEGSHRVIRELFIETFGSGVDLQEFPSTNPTYDGHTEIDIETFLALAFLEQFTGNEKLSREAKTLDPPVPEAIDPLGKDLTEYLSLYGPQAPVAEAISHVSTIISLRLFQLPLISARALDSAYNGSWLDAHKGQEIFCDFVGQRGTPSDDLSRLCVLRDLELLRTFFGQRLLLRSLGDAAQIIPTKPELGASAEEVLKGLAALRDNGEINMALAMKLTDIDNAVEPSDEDTKNFIAEIQESELPAWEKLSSVLVEGLRKRGLENQVKWFWSTGGITKPYGVLAGTLSSRTTWRYAPSDEALTALLMMCFIESDGNRTSKRLPIREVIRRLRERFGLLIDEPPVDFDSADARAACSQNLNAFTDRLQLLGCFEGLSDDFSAQFVTRPRAAVQ